MSSSLTLLVGSVVCPANRTQSAAKSAYRFLPIVGLTNFRRRKNSAANGVHKVNLLTCEASHCLICVVIIRLPLFGRPVLHIEPCIRTAHTTSRF
jgi:hypothetical protein